MRIIVLGATGQVGSVVLETLRRRFGDQSVVAAVRNTSSTAAPTIQFEPYTSEWSALGKADVLVNCIGIIAETRSMSFDKAHVELAQLILKNRNLLGNPRIINLSVLGVEKQIDSPFLDTKRIADDLLLAEPETFMIRPSLVCTHDTVIVQKFRMLKNISKVFFRTLFFPGGFLRTRVQPVMGTDVAAVIAEIAAGKTSHRTVQLVGPEVFTIADLLRFADSRMKIVPFSQRVFNFFFSAGSRLLPSLINPEQFKLLQEDNVGDNSVASELLARPMASTREFWISELK